MTKLLKHNISVFIYALLSTFFFTFSVSEDVISLFPAQSGIVIQSVILLFFYFLYKKLLSVCNPPHNLLFMILAVIISSIFCYASVMGVFFSADSSLAALSSITFAVILKLILLLLGGFSFFYVMILAIDSVSGHIRNISMPGLHKVCNYLFDKGIFIKSLLIMTICWLPQIIIRYPGSMPIDSEVCIFQYYGLRKYTTQHPIIYTQLLGHFSDLGNALGNISLGLFLLILLQCICLLLVLAYTIHTMREFNAPNWLLFITLILFSAAPVFSGYATILIVDVFYDTAILLLINELTWYLFRQNIFKKEPKHYILTIIAVLGMYFRQNGFYLMIVLIFFVAIRELYLIRHKKQTIRCAALILALLFIPLCAGKLNTSLLHKKYKATRVSTRVMMALPLQQTSRYMVYHSDDLSHEEREVISSILSYTDDEFKEKYNPYNFDGIKKGFTNHLTKKDLLAYIQTWFKLFLRHPDTYINATLNQNYCLFSPLANNSKYYGTVRSRITEITTPDFNKLYEDITVLNNSAKKGVMTYYQSFYKFPIIGLYVNQGLINLLLLAICLYALCEKNGRLLLLGLPLLLTLAIIFVGPAAYGHPRYTFPVHYAMPLLVCIFISRKGLNK
nr:DUF6020 family protein [uncultured Blautia sp.]